MELNLDRLNSLRVADFKEAPPQLQAETKQRKPEDKQAEPRPAEKPAQGLTGGLGELQLQADAKRLDISRSLEICQQYQENSKRSSQLQTELLKGVQAGEDIYTLFLKAIEAISKMTANTLFYSQIEGDIKSVYGMGLQEPAPLRMKLTETQERLSKLLEAEQRETDYNGQERIKRAILAHRNRIAELEAMLDK